MKKIIILISLLLTFLIIQKENTFAYCCDLIQIQVSYFDNCCIQLEVINPSCNSIEVYFDQYDSAEGNFKENDTVNIDENDTARAIYCSKYNETSIIYRIRIGDAITPEYDPECPGRLDPMEWVEGYTQFTDTIEVGNCCLCPINVNNWLTLSVEKNSIDCPDGCKVIPILNIPDSITCYSHYSIQTDYDDSLSPARELSNLFNDWVCVPIGESIEFNVVLLQNGNINANERFFEDSLCLVQKTSAYCDTCPCPSNKEQWLTVVVQKDEEYCPDGCRVAMHLEIPDEYNCYNYYELVYPDNMLDPVRNIYTDPIDDHTFCMNENTSGNIWVVLKEFANQSWDSACIILYPVTCDSTITNPDSLQSSCYDDCNEVWEEQIPYRFQIYSGCWVTVEYEKRTGCPPEDYQDIHIKRISRGFNCSEGIPLKELFSVAFWDLVNDNPMGFNPIGLPDPDTTCYDTWRLFDTQCKMNLLTMDTAGHIQFTQVACPGMPCCVQGFRVCRDSSGKAFISPIGGFISPQSSNCLWIPDSLLYLPGSLASISVTPSFPMNTCITDCDSSKIDWEQASLHKYGFNQFTDRKYEIISKVEKIYFNCYEQYPCSYSVELYDSMGRKLTELRGFANAVKNEIDLKKYIIDKGMYLYRISVNGNIIGTGKIIR